MIEPDWTKLLMPLDEVDVDRVLSHWAWLLDRPVRPWRMNRFGDWFLASPTGVVWRLDILEGTFGIVAGSEAEFESRCSRDDELLDWFQDGMVLALYEAGLVPGRGQGFGYAAHPVLGGSLERSNVRIVEMSSWQIFVAQLHDRLRFVPVGARITRLLVDDNGTVRIEHDSW